MEKAKKPTLLRLRQRTTITTQDIAQKAGVSLSEAYVVEIGGFATKEIAEKVLRAFSELSGMRYTLNDIRLQNVSLPIRQRASLSDLETIEHPIPPRKSSVDTMAKRGRAGKGEAPKKRDTQPLDVGDCTCSVLRATVGEDHAKDCPLYRQRGSGISVLNGPRERLRTGW